MKILFVHAYMASFTRADLEILRSEHEVRELRFRRAPLHFLPSVARVIAGALWADAIVSWFGTIHTLVAFLAGRAFGRPCLVVAGGYDVAREPEIGYGNMLPGFRRWIGHLAFRLATRVLAFSENAKREAIANAGVAAEKIETMYLGVVTPAPQGKPTPARRRGALTVAILNRGNLVRKGLRTFVEAARALPDVPFVLVGGSEDDAIDVLRATAPPNVQLAGWQSNADLHQMMQSAAVYVQVSFHEGFGVALAEAMLCGCVPVVTDRGSLPEVVGDTGLVVPFGDAPATSRAIETALTKPELGEAARQRIATKFSPDVRRRRLLQVIREAR